MTDSQKKHPSEKAPQASQKSSKIWLLLVSFVFMGIGFFLYFNVEVMNWLKGKDFFYDSVVVEANSYDRRFEDQKTLLNTILISLAEIKTHLEDVKDAQLLLSQRLKKLEESPSVTFKIEEEQEGVLRDLFNSFERRLRRFERALIDKATLKGAYKNFKQQVLSGKSFGEEYEALNTFLNPHYKEILETLSPYKGIGIPRSEVLLKDFEAVKTDLLQKSPVQGSLWEKVVGQIKTLVTIQKKGEPKEGITGRLEEIDFLLTLKNFERALNKSKNIHVTSSLKEAWENHVQAHIDGERVLEKLSSTMTAAQKDQE